MPTLSNLVLKDSALVDHTFVPRDIRDGTGLLVESTGVPVGEKRITVSGKKSARRFKPEISIAIPVVVNEVINGVTVPRVDLTNRVRLLFDFDERSTTTQRADVKAHAREILLDAKTLPHAVIVALEGVFG